MSTFYLKAGERRYRWWPFWGLPSPDTVPAIQVGRDGPWVPMELDTGYVANPPVADGAKWFRVFLAHPDTDPYAGVIVVPIGTSTVQFRVIGSPEIEIPDPEQYVTAR